MEYEEFISIVEQLAHVRDEDIERATRAVLQTLAERISKAEAQARDHASAVFLTLREALGNEEFSDVTVQLPPEYAVLWTRR